MLKLGKQNIKGLYLGEQEVKKVYLGDKLVFSAAKSSRLPEGYTEVQYINFQKISKFYLSTGFKFDFSTSKIVLDVQGYRGATTGNSTMLGASSKTGFNVTAYIVYSTNRFWFEAGSTRLDTNLAGGNRYTITFDGPSKKVLYSNNLERSFSFSAGNGESEEIVFGSQTGQCAYMNVYSMQAYDNDVLVRDYISCISPDGTPGLYDSVNRNFIGSKSLNAGPTVDTQ